mgnify:CR=1 FL=1
MENKFLKLAELRELEKQVTLGEISYSRMVEIINEKHTNKLREELIKFYKFLEKENQYLHSAGWSDFWSDKYLRKQNDK